VDSFDGETDDPPSRAHPLFSAGDAENVDLAGQVGGAFFAMAVQGN